MKYILLKSFLKGFDSYQQIEQELILDTIEKIKDYLENNNASFGLRIKRLSTRIYEARINIYLRIVYFREKDIVKFVCLGSHDDIKRFLKNIS
jgi:mRNA-degrading endonuclease YafQ of YafQ-DinJ toxin-antitoxin module